jgi:hypothetical protein
MKLSHVLNPVLEVFGLREEDEDSAMAAFYAAHESCKCCGAATADDDSDPLLWALVAVAVSISIHAFSVIVRLA